MCRYFYFMEWPVYYIGALVFFLSVLCTRVVALMQNCVSIMLLCQRVVCLWRDVYNRGAFVFFCLFFHKYTRVVTIQRKCVSVMF